MACMKERLSIGVGKTVSMLVLRNRQPQKKAYKRHARSRALGLGYQGLSYKDSLATSEAMRAMERVTKRVWMFETRGNIMFVRISKRWSNVPLKTIQLLMDVAPSMSLKRGHSLVLWLSLYLHDCNYCGFGLCYKLAYTIKRNTGPSMLQR